MKFPVLWFCCIGFGAVCCLPVQAPARGDDHGQKLNELLGRGQLVVAQQHFDQVLRQQPQDQAARTARGLVEFLQALEYLGQANYRYGLIQRHAANLPLARLPVPANPAPEQLSYAALREAVAGFQQRLATAESTLAGVETANVLLPLYLGRVRLDLTGDGQLADEETLWQIFAAINTAVDREQGEGFSIGFDGADIHWLRGYCHFLMAFCDGLLAYDEQELFERCGQLLFPKIESPYRTAQERVSAGEEPPEMSMIFDAIAAIHLLHFPLREPQRLASAHQHLLAMIDQSRRCWERAEAETDDEHEWIPNPRQTGVLQVAVTAEVITGWHKVLDEFEAILQGKRLIPYWRAYVGGIFSTPQIPAHGTGLNVKKFLLEPTDFDLVLTIQGTQIERYLEEGDLTTPEAWDELTRVFRGQFFGFAIWFN